MPDGEPGLNYLCAGLKAYFAHVDPYMRVLADLLRRGRPAADIMPMLAGRTGVRYHEGHEGAKARRRDDQQAQSRNAYAGVGRNERCPCGSGPKFKRCRGAGRPPAESAQVSD
jgi:uncharacterized protein